MAVNPSHEVAVRTLNFRAEPSIRAAIVGKLSLGHEVEKIRAVDGFWCEIRTLVGMTERQGFVAEKYLELPVAAPPASGPADITITFAKLKRLAPGGKDKLLQGIADHAATVLGPYDILDSALRLRHFLAQVAHESAGFRTVYEYGGRSYFARYNNRSDLGNGPDDGYRYRGRGFIQLTGRSNYRTIGGRIGIDLENDPDRAADPEVALTTAGDYWQMRSINRQADKDDIVKVTKLVNGGTNGLSDRIRYFEKSAHLWV